MSNSRGTEQNVLFYFNSVITIVIVVFVAILILKGKSRGPEGGPERGAPRFVYTRHYDQFIFRPSMNLGK